MDGLKKLINLYDFNFFLKKLILYLDAILIVFLGVYTVDQKKSWIINLGLDERTWKIIKLNIMNRFFILLIPCLVGFIVVRFLFEKNIIYSFLIFAYPLIFLAFILGVAANVYVISLLVIYAVLEVWQKSYLKIRIEKLVWDELELVPGFFCANYEKNLPELTVAQDRFDHAKRESTFVEYRVKFKQFNKISSLMTYQEYLQMLEMGTLFFLDTKIELESKSGQLKFSYQDLYQEFNGKGKKNEALV